MAKRPNTLGPTTHWLFTAAVSYSGVVTADTKAASRPQSCPTGEAGSFDDRGRGPRSQAIYPAPADKSPNSEKIGLAATKCWGPKVKALAAPDIATARFPPETRRTNGLAGRRSPAPTRCAPASGGAAIHTESVKQQFKSMDFCTRPVQAGLTHQINLVQSED